MRYFPDKLPKGRLPMREYFFNVLNTCNNEYVTQLVKHANAQRHSIAKEDQQREAIFMSEGWFQKLNEQPFISSKYA